jgi:hypothetical protein
MKKGYGLYWHGVIYYLRSFVCLLVVHRQGHVLSFRDTGDNQLWLLCFSSMAVKSQ